MVFGPTTFDSVVTMSDQKIVRLAPGDLSATSTDAVNGSQLYATNQSITNLAGKIGDAVQYDSSAHDSVTLRGAGSTAPVALKNVAAGAVKAASTDAVNGSQLYGLASSTAAALGGSTSVKTDGSIGATRYVLSGKTYNNVGDALGALSESSGPDPLAVHYDDSSMSGVTLGGSGHSPVVLSNVAAGTAPTDAVNVAQMKQAVITGNPYIAGIGTGAAATATSPGAVALGLGSVANTPYSISVGNTATGLVRRITNVATAVDDSDAVNLGQVKSMLDAAPDVVNTGVSETRTMLKASASLSSAVQASGNAASPSNASEMRPLVASPVGLAATDASAVHYDSDAHGQITLGSASGGNVKLTGLQDAALTAGSTDAATGGQLYVTNQQVASLNAAVQNISTSGSTGVAINSTNGIATATGVQSIAVGAGAVASGANSTAIGDSSNAKANNSVALGANSVADRDRSVSVGAVGSERQIVNVAAGTQGTDAVNLNQLNNAMTQQSNAVNQQIGNLQNSINTVSKNAYSGVAAAMAMPNLTPSGPGRTVVAAGGGYYMGGSAAAVGVTYRSANMHWLVNGGVSLTSTGNMAARTQVGYEF
ncbi:YadA family autotransporter adhesin [Paraburkholderia hiiakae]|nr:YadA-like family protein [Paraburkholderia hiiakae]